MCLCSSFRKPVYSYFPGVITCALYVCILNWSVCRLAFNPFCVINKECLGAEEWRDWGCTQISRKSLGVLVTFGCSSLSAMKKSTFAKLLSRVYQSSHPSHSFPFLGKLTYSCLWEQRVANSTCLKYRMAEYKAFSHLSQIDLEMPKNFSF